MGAERRRIYSSQGFRPNQRAVSRDDRLTMGKSPTQDLTESMNEPWFPLD